MKTDNPDNLPCFIGLEDLARYEELARVRSEVSFIKFVVCKTHMLVQWFDCVIVGVSDFLIVRIAMRVKIQH